MATPTPAEVLLPFQQATKRMNQKIQQVDNFMGAYTRKLHSHRVHGLITNALRVNANGTIDKHVHNSGTANRWERLDNGADALTPWFGIGRTNNRQHGVFSVALSSAFRHKTDRTKFRVEVDLVFAGGFGMPDPAHPGDVTKIVPITNAYLSNLHRSRGKTLWLNQNNLHMVNTYTHRYLHPAIRYGVGQGIWARLRVKALDGGTKALKDTLNPGQILRIVEAGHYASI